MVIFILLFFMVIFIFVVFYDYYYFYYCDISSKNCNKVHHAVPEATQALKAVQNGASAIQINNLTKLQSTSINNVSPLTGPQRACFGGKVPKIPFKWSQQTVH